MISKIKLIDYLREAYQYAWINSHDTSTKVGAVLVGPVIGLMVTRGSNQYPGSLRLDPWSYERPFKYKIIEHAERAVIFKAARQGIKTNGLILIATWACCPDCARAIILSGIKEVYTHKQSFEMTPERWKDDINLGIKMLKDNGISFNLIDCLVGGVTGLFNGKEWKP